MIDHIGSGLRIRGRTGNGGDLIKNGVFSANNAHLNSWNGGDAVYSGLRTDSLYGNIVDSAFSHNKTGMEYITGRGQSGFHYSGLMVNGNFDGNLAGSRFLGNVTSADNKATSARYTGLFVGGNFSGEIRVSDFRDNNAGAVYIAGSAGATAIADTRFIGNRAIDNGRDGRQLIRAGGIVRSAANLHIQNGTAFLGNRLEFEGSKPTGWTGAVRHDAKGEHQVMVSAENQGLVRFYANRAAGRHEGVAISFGGAGAADTHAIIAADEGSRVLMFDAMASDARFGLYVDVAKEGAGDWFLGSTSHMRSASTWRINAGRLILTTVDGRTAKIRLEHGKTADFTLGDGGTLAGSGAIDARAITLGGTIAPDVWVNTGTKADAINSAITDAGIDSINASRDAPDGGSRFGILGFTGPVSLDNARYDVDVDLGTGQSDLLVVHGALVNQGHSAVKVSSLGWKDGKLPDSDDSAALGERIARVISATGGIQNPGGLHVTTGGKPWDSTAGADFLRVDGYVTRDEDATEHYDLRLGLSWHSTARNAQGDLTAHGDFTVDDTFTLNHGLAARAALIDAPTAKGWHGNTLTKKGAGTLIMNGVNTYTGLTRVESGTLMAGDASARDTAFLAGGVQVLKNASLMGTGTVAGDVDVFGNVQGTPTIHGLLHVHDGAVLSPGFAGIGEITTGELRLDSGAVYAAKLDGLNSDRVHVRANHGGSGMAFLDGASLRVGSDGTTDSAGWNLDTLYTLIDTDAGVNGKFGHVDSTLALLAPEVIYDDRLKVQLRMKRNKTSMGPGDGGGGGNGENGAGGAGGAGGANSTGGTGGTEKPDAAGNAASSGAAGGAGSAGAVDETDGTGNSGSAGNVDNAENTGAAGNVGNAGSSVPAENPDKTDKTDSTDSTDSNTPAGNTLCRTHNQCSVGRALDALEAANNKHPIIHAIHQTDATTARAALDNLSGEIYATTRTALLGNTRLRDSVQQHLRTPAAGHTSAGRLLWVEPWVHQGTLKNPRGAIPTHTSGRGAALGLERSVNAKLLAGVFLAWEDDSVHHSGLQAARSKIKAVSLGGAARRQDGRVTVHAGVAYSHVRAHTRRTLWLRGIEGQTQASWRGHKVQVFAEGTRDFALNESATLSPYLGMAQALLHTQGTTEHGTTERSNAAALAVQSQTDAIFHAALGVRGTVRVDVKTPVLLSADLGLARTFGDTESVTTHRFANTGTGTDTGRGTAAFDVRGAAQESTTAHVGINAHIQLRPHTVVQLGYRGQFGHRSREHAARVQLRVVF